MRIRAPVSSWIGQLTDAAAKIILCFFGYFETPRVNGYEDQINIGLHKNQSLHPIQNPTKPYLF